MKVVVGALLLYFLVLVLPAAGEDEALTAITFIPQWIPQAQFAGYYVAHDTGIYRKHGLDVKILRGGPDRPSSECLRNGEADIATLFLSTGIEKKSHGVNLVNIGQIVQRSSLMLVAKKSNGIHTPEDINDKTVGLWNADFQIQPKAFFRRNNLTVQVIPQSTTLNLFLWDGVDVASAMWYNEYHTILNSGIDPDELTTFFLSDHSVDIPEDGIYCLEETYRSNPEPYGNFVQASLEGWQYAFDHPEEALDIVMSYITEGNNGTNRVHQRWMLDRMRDIIMPDGTTTSRGILPEATYEKVAGELLKNNLIETIPPYNQFFLPCRAHD